MYRNRNFWQRRVQTEKGTVLPGLSRLLIYYQQPNRRYVLNVQYYKHEPKETVQKPEDKVMRNQNTEECLEHCLPNANQKSAN